MKLIYDIQIENGFYVQENSGNWYNNADNVVICCHGFAGSKNSSSTMTLAEHLSSKYKYTIVLSFDWPCHGKDVSEELTLERCDAYLTKVIEYARKCSPQAKLYANGTSFGGYLLLKYIADHGNPFKKVVLRSTAVTMHDILVNTIMNADDRNAIANGEVVKPGFDVKIPVTASFVDSLADADIRKNDYRNFQSDILMIHGTDDEIVPYSDAADFAEKQGITLHTVTGADHRFSEQNHKENAITRACEFFDLKEPSVERNKALQAQYDAFIEGEHKRGKEPFDFEKFTKNYLHDRGSCQSLSPNESPFVKAQYRSRYYDHPEIMTVADFGNYLDKMDSYS